MTSLLAGTAIFGLSAVVHAADMGGPYRAAPQVISAAPEPAFSSGWYLRGDVGIGLMQKGSWAETTIDSGLYAPSGWDSRKLDNVAIFGVGAGYQINEYLRGDVTVQYRTRSKVSGVNSITDTWNTTTPQTPGGWKDRIDGKLDSFVVMANGYADLGRFSGFTPYVGAGIGVAYNRLSQIDDYGVGTGNAGASGSYGSSSNGSFAWALHGGFAYDLTQNLKMDLGYTYMNLGEARSGDLRCGVPCSGGSLRIKDITSHDIHLGLRYVFSEPAPTYVQRTPIVAKY
jgi:opacity protein-like surface antigen